MEWTKAAGSMLTRLKADLRNHQLLADPWSRAAHSMVQACRIRAKRRCLAVPPSRRLPCRDWKEAVCRMKASLDSRAKDQAMKGTWTYWAAHRPPLTRR